MTLSSRIHGALSLIRKHRNHQNHGKVIQQLHSQIIFVHRLLSPQHSLNVWNYLIHHYALSDTPHVAFVVFKYLHRQGCSSFDSFTYSFLLKATSNYSKPDLGQQIHCCCYKIGLENMNVYVPTALVDMYVKCGYLIDAEKVFDRMPVRNHVTWNALITGLVKWSQMGLAQRFFDLMPLKNVVSWTGLIDGYTRSGQFYEALSLFQRMMSEENTKPSEVTLLAIFPAIWNARHISYCRAVHGYGEKSGLIVLDTRLMNCLVDAYAKCGSIKCAEQTFEEIAVEKRSIVTWTSIISGFAMHGMAKEASGMFQKMERNGIKPNSITFLGILNGCSHNGLVNEGLKYFEMMDSIYGLIPVIKHYGCLIDMLGRSGRVEEAEAIVEKIPIEFNSVVIWRTLLGACFIHGNIRVAERVKNKIIEIERKYGGDYVLMSNIFCDFGMFMDSERVRKSMDEESVDKVPGFSVSGHW